MEGAHVVGHGQQFGKRKSPSGVQGQSPGRAPGRSTPEAEAKCEISVQLFNEFLQKIQDLMSIGAELGQYTNFANTIKKILKILLGGLT